jgi:L-lactate dehydrogenase
LGVPAVINRSGVREVIELNLTEEERKKLHHSAHTLTRQLQSLK